MSVRLRSTYRGSKRSRSTVKPRLSTWLKFSRFHNWKPWACLLFISCVYDNHPGVFPLHCSRVVFSWIGGVDNSSRSHQIIQVKEKRLPSKDHSCLQLSMIITDSNNNPIMPFPILLRCRCLMILHIPTEFLFAKQRCILHWYSCGWWTGWRTNSRRV